MFSVTKTYELSLVKTYVSHWQLNHALRELIQNALDSPSPFVYEFKKQSDGTTTLVLNSALTVLTPNTLLLGATSKAEDAKSIGSFGEGFKIALLVLTRLGYDVDIHNGHNLWKPKFQYNKNFDDDLLVIEETSLPTKRNKGLTFFVYGLTQNDVNDLVECCIRMQQHIGAIKMTKFGDILLEQPGKLYVGGLFICSTDLKFGYNVLPEYVKLERDRRTVDNWDLKCITRDMWYDTKDFDRIAQMVQDEVPDLAYVKYDSPELVKEACYQLFRKNNPGKLLAESLTDLNEKVKSGMTQYVYAGGLGEIATRARSYRADLSYTASVPMISPKEYLTQWLSANRKEMRGKAIIAFKDIIKESDKWQRK